MPQRVFRPRPRPSLLVRRSLASGLVGCLARELVDFGRSASCRQAQPWSQIGRRPLPSRSTRNVCEIPLWVTADGRLAGPASLLVEGVLVVRLFTLILLNIGKSDACNLFFAEGGDFGNRCRALGWPKVIGGGKPRITKALALFVVVELLQGPRTAGCVAALALPR